MKLHELLVLSEKEPEKYKGKKYKLCDGEFALNASGEEFKEVQFVDCEGEVYLAVTGYGANAYLPSFAELEEVRQTVPFMEALKAFGDGHKISSKLDNQISYYNDRSKGLRDADGYSTTVKEILEGIWTIEE